MTTKGAKRRSLQNQRIFWFAILAAAGLSLLLSAVTQLTTESNAVVVLLFACSIALLLTGCILALLPSINLRLEPKGILLGALVLALACAFRFHLLPSQPYGAWFDEAQNSIEAQRIWSEPGYWPIFIGEWTQLPAFLFYLYAPLAAHWPASVLGVRLAAALAGLLSIFFTWALAREMFGARVAWCAALLLSMQRWHVNFSRFGMAQIFSALFICAALFFWLRAVRRKDVVYAALAGVTVGIAMQTYYSMFVLVPMVAICAAFMILRRELPLLRGVTYFALVVLCATIAYAPVLNFATMHWEVFSQRIRTVAAVKPSTALQTWDVLVKGSKPSPELVELGDTVLKHLQMFHLVGDANGRHNLPGAPMLDLISGVLFALGLAWAILTFWRSSSFVLLLWVGATLCAGIFSLAFEAPQGGRTIGITPALSILGALPLGAVLQLSLRPALNYVRNGAIVLLLAVCAFLNWDTYFNRQLRDGGAWASFSSPETIVGEIMRSEEGHADVYTMESWVGGPSVELLAGKNARAYSFSTGSTLPLSTISRDAYIVLDSSMRGSLDTIKQLYPQAQLTPRGPQDQKGKLLQDIVTVARIPAQARSALAGWNLQLVSSAAAPLKVPSHKFDLNGLASRSALRMQGAIKFPYSDSYCLSVQGATLDSVSLCDQTVQYSERGFCFDTAEGICSIDLALSQPTAPQAVIELRRPSSPDINLLSDSAVMLRREAFLGGLRATYANEKSPKSAFSRIDSKIDVYFHLLPQPLPFSVKWEGLLRVEESGYYELALRTIDRSELSIDGKSRLVQSDPGTTSSVVLNLEAGAHPIVIDYQAITGYSQAYFYWKRPGQELEIVPSSALRPMIYSRLMDPSAPSEVVSVNALK